MCICTHVKTCNKHQSHICAYPYSSQNAPKLSTPKSTQHSQNTTSFANIPRINICTWNKRGCIVGAKRQTMHRPSIFPLQLVALTFHVTFKTQMTNCDHNFGRVCFETLETLKQTKPNYEQPTVSTWPSCHYIEHSKYREGLGCAATHGQMSSVVL